MTFPAEMFDTRTRRKILRVLAEKNKRYTIADLAEMCHRSHATISRALQEAERYPFLTKSTLPGSKQLVFSLNSESAYSTAIREFFRTEKRQERHNGTVPVDVWNLLEDVTHHVETGLDSFVEVFLFGSYATGEYYSGSDIDLLIVHQADQRAIDDQLDAMLQSFEPAGRLHVVSVGLAPGTAQQTEGEELLDMIRTAAPLRDIDTLIPLSGAVGER